MNRCAYDPKAFGAQCDLCPLQGASDPVPPETHPGAGFVVLARSPGADELEKGRPLVGAYGKAIQQALQQEGYARKDAHWTNVVLCAGSGDDWWEIMRARVSKARTKAQRSNQRIAAARALAKKEGRTYDGPEEERVPLYPEEACRVRLLRELSPYTRVLAFGKEGYEAVSGKIGKIAKVRGTLNVPEHPSDLYRRGLQRRRELRPGEEIIPVRSVKLLPTTLDIRRLKKVMERDVGRAARWFQGRLSWTEPRRLEQPTPAQLRGWLWQNRGFTTWDIETRAIRFDHKKKVQLLDEEGHVVREEPKPLYDPLDDRVRLIGFGTPKNEDGSPQQTVIVQLEDLEVPGHRFYSEEDEAQIWQIWFEWLEDPTVPKVGWNSAGYDHTVMDSESRRRRGRPLVIRNHFDGICYHHVVEPEYRHSLGFAGSYYTDVPAWKEDDTATTAAKNEPYRIYAGRDNGVTGQVFPIIRDQAHEINAHVPRHYGYPSLLDVEHGMMAVCRGMHRVGLLVDQRESYGKKGEPLGRLAWDKELQSRASFWRGDGDGDSVPAETRRVGLRQALLQLRRIRPKVPHPDQFNPNSVPDLRELMFDALELPVADNVQIKDLYTKTGDRSTGDTVLRSYVGDARLHPWERQAIHALRMYRRWMKIRGTFVKPMEIVRDEHGEILWSEDRHVHADGRIHPSYMASGTKVGRIAASGPNVLNLYGDIKSMYRAAPGHKIVGADQSALHLRIIGALWGIPSLLEAFLGKPRYHRGVLMSAHELFAELLFGDVFMKAPYGEWPGENAKGKWLGSALGMRSCSKTTRYAGAYGAKPPTIYREVTSAEEKDTGKLPFAHMAMEQIEDMYETWMSAEPQWPQAWSQAIARFQELKYAESKILGRRAWFLAGKETEIPNFDVLSLEADLMNMITCELAEAIPFEYAGPGTGLIHQNYDSVAVECPEGPPIDVEVDGKPLRVGKEAWRVRNIIQEIGSRTLPGMCIPFVMEGKIGDHLGEV